MLKNLKKLIFALLILPLSLCFVSCGNSNGGSDNSNKNPETPSVKEATFKVNVDFNLPEKYSFLADNVSKDVSVSKPYVIPTIPSNLSEYFLGWYELTSRDNYLATEILGSEDEVISIYAEWKTNELVRFFENGNLTYEFYEDGETKTATVTGYDSESNVKDIIIPQSVIKDETFYTVTKIADRAFENAAIDSVSTYATQISVGNNAFLNSTVKDIDFSVFDEIGDNAFESTKVKNATFAATFSSIGKESFKNCSNLESVDFSLVQNVIENLPVSVFEGCSSLTDVSLNPNFVSIGNYAFKNCSSLENVDFLSYSKLESIGNYAFDGCIALNNVVVPENVTTIGYHIFENCTGLFKLSVSRLDYQTGYNFSTFYGSLGNSLKEIDIIGDAVTSLPDNYFANYSALETLVMSNSITSVGKAFSGATSLLNITFSENINALEFDASSLSDTAWYKNQTDIVVLNKVLIFAPDTLSGTVNIPNTVEYIAKRVFNNNKNITMVTIPSSVKVIANSAFNYCENLETVIIDQESELETIDAYAFYYCTSLSSIDIANCTKLETIGELAFYKVGSIEIFSIPNSVESIGESAFAGSSINSFTTTANSKYEAQNGVLFEKNQNGKLYKLLAYPRTKTEQIYFIPSTVTVLAKRSFESCNSNLIYLYVDKDSTGLSIEERAFASSNQVYILSEIQKSSITIGSYNANVAVYYYLESGYSVAKNDDTFEFTFEEQKLSETTYFVKFVIEEETYYFRLNIKVNDTKISVEKQIDITEFLNEK
jgi:hypothetical protein